MNKIRKIRTRFVINRSYQFSLVSLVLAQTLITSLLLIGVFYYFVQMQSEFMADMSLGSEKSVLIKQWTGSLYRGVGVVVILAAVFNSGMALLMSHRSAGPMHRLKDYLANISRGGRPKQVSFRKNDQFRDVQDSYNEMVGVLEKERQNDLRIVHQIEDGIAHLKKLARDEQMFQAVEYLERLNNDLKNFKIR